MHVHIDITHSTIFTKDPKYKRKLKKTISLCNGNGNRKIKKKKKIQSSDCIQPIN